MHTTSQRILPATERVQRPNDTAQGSCALARYANTAILMLCGSVLAAAPAYSPCSGGSEASREYREELEKRYGVPPCIWSGYADQEAERPVADLFKKHAASSGMTASFVFTIACGEGLNRWMDKPENRKNGLVDLKKPVSGFGYLGTDVFCSDLTRLKAAKLIRDDFSTPRDYVCVEKTNEQNQKVQSADFPDLDRGLEAFVAMLRLRRSLVVKDAAAASIHLTDEQLSYWIYAYYVDGEGDGRADLLKTKGDFSKSTRGEIKKLSLQRLASWRIVQRYSLLKD